MMMMVVVVVVEKSRIAFHVVVVVVVVDVALTRQMTEQRRYWSTLARGWTTAQTVVLICWSW